MKKHLVLKYLPTLKEMKKDLKQKQAQIGKLSEEILRDEGIIADLDGVTLHEEFPIAVINTNDTTTEVWSGCDDVSRYAVLSTMVDGSDRWRVTGYRSEETVDGIAIGEGLNRSKALRMAKDFVATGRISKPNAEATASAETAPKKRGRPKKVQPA